MLQTTAIVLAGGFSTRLGQDKGLRKLGTKPLVTYVLDTTKTIADERIIVVSSEEQAKRYCEISTRAEAKLVTDSGDLRGPLAGASTGLKSASGTYSLLLPCDTPFIKRDIASLLFELCINMNAVIPRYPNCYIEPLQAVYCTKAAARAAQEALTEGMTNMQAMVERLRRVRYVSTLVLQQIDPELRTFFNVNTQADLKKAEAMLQSIVRRRRL